MGLKLIKENGVVRKIWYGQYKEHGKWKVTRLLTPMHGERIPDHISERGDDAFERSRIRAQAEFDEFERSRRQKGCSEHLTQVLIESKTGQAIEYVRVADIESKWRMTHGRKRNENWDMAITWMFKTFTDSVTCEYIYEVTPEMISAFYDKIRGEYAWSVVQRMMRLISGAFAILLPVGTINPFSKVVVTADKETQKTIHRRPLSEKELADLFDEARKDPLIYALTISAACTGMRIGDVCNLEWKSVDLKNGLIDLKTRKTGQEVTVPIFPKLKAVLKTAREKSDSRDRYVFPEAARMYANSYSSVIKIGKLLFARALCLKDSEREIVDVEPDREVPTPKKIIESIRNSGFSAKKAAKAEKVYSLYCSGMTYREIERETGFSRGQISGYLHEIEEITGVTIVKCTKASPTSIRNLLKKTRQERKVGKHAASLYGWHSLRASFVVQALTAGIPIEAVRMVVGHSTMEMTLEYFNPTRRVMAETIRKGMKRNILADDDHHLLETPVAHEERT